MGLISIFLFLFGFFTFIKKHKYFTLIVIVVLSSGYFRLVNSNFFLGPISLQHGDLALLLIFLLLPFRKKLNNKQLKGIQRALTLFLIFLVVSIVYDFFFRGTSLMQIFRTTRKIGYLAFFFLFNSFSWHDYKKFIRFLIVIVVIHSLLYISQYVFGYSFTSAGIAIDELDGLRYSNAPTYILPILVICVFALSNIKTKISLIILFLIVIVLTQSRGAIISVMSVLLLYLFLQTKIKLHTLLFISLVIIIGYNITLSYLPVIGVRFLHLFEQINLVGEMNYNNLQSFFHQGSFIFRLGVTYERLMYVLEEPMRIIFGVGFVPDMDITTPIFIVGTASPVLPTGFEQYNSVDIFFPNIITRYGIVGSLIFLYFIFQLFTLSFKNRELLWGKILFTYLVAMAFISLINETFYNGQYFVFIFILLGMVVIERK